MIRYMKDWQRCSSISSQNRYISAAVDVGLIGEKFHILPFFSDVVGIRVIPSGAF